MFTRKRLSQLSVLFSVFAVCVYLLQPQPEVAIIAALPQKNYQIVLLDQNQMLVPLSVKLDAALAVEQVLPRLIEQMKVNQAVTPLFAGFLHQDLQCASVRFDKAHVNIDCNAAFLTYDDKYELKILEALMYVSAQLGAKQLSFSVDGNQLHYMPMKKTSIHEPLTAKIGINNFISTTGNIHNSKSIVVYYQKRIQDKIWLVPRSVRVAKEKITMRVLLDEIMRQVFVSSMVEQPLSEAQMHLEKEPLIEKDAMTLYLHPDILEDERSIDEMLLKGLLLSIRSNSAIKKVKIIVNEQVIAFSSQSNDWIILDEISFNVLS